MADQGPDRLLATNASADNNIRHFKAQSNIASLAPLLAILDPDTMQLTKAMLAAPGNTMYASTTPQATSQEVNRRLAVA